MKSILLQLTIAAGLLSHGAVAEEAVQQEAFRNVSKYHQDYRNLAIDGWDPVSYFQDQPQRGLQEHTLVYGEITFRFASLENQEEFLSDPGKYEPTYGGHCAWAMATGARVPIDPEYYSFDYNDEGERIRLHLFVAQSPMESWYFRAIEGEARRDAGLRRRSLRGLTAIELDALVQSELAEKSPQVYTSAYRGFQENADFHWREISGELPRLPIQPE